MDKSISPSSDAVVLKKVHKLKSSHYGWIVHTLYYPKFQYLVSCSKDYTIRIWDMRNYENIHTYKAHTSYVRHIVKFTENDIFLSCCDDGRIFSFSVRDFNYSKLMHNDKTSKIFNICCLDEDRFLSISSVRMCVHSFSKNGEICLMKNLDDVHVCWTVRTLRCETYPDCIIYNATRAENTTPAIMHPIIIRNFETLKTRKVLFNRKGEHNTVYFLKCFKHKGRELLVCGGFGITFYDLRTGSLLKEFQEFANILGSKNVPTCCLFLENYFVFGGSDDTGAKVLDVCRLGQSVPGEVKNWSILSSHAEAYGRGRGQDGTNNSYFNKKYRCITLISVETRGGRSSVRFVASTQEGWIGGELEVFEISNLDLMEERKKSQIQEDLDERIQFIRNEREVYMFDEAMKSNHSIDLRLFNITFENLFKWVFQE